MREKKLSRFKKHRERIRFLEGELGIDLEAIGEALQDDESKVYCENLVGAVSLPLGVAGPLKIVGEHVKGDYYLPLATTEGALVASVSRGCKAIDRSGGTSVSVHRVGTTRGPVFSIGSLTASKVFFKWIRKNERRLAKQSELTSKHIKLKSVDVRTVTPYAFVRFYFDTQDAMGMNMATIATEKIVKLIEKETKAKCVSLAGNFDIDKKPAWINVINNRGFKAWAEVVLNKRTITSVLKTTPQKLQEVWLSKCMIGSYMSGSLGFNAHFANIVAAFFAATGQDLAHVVEGSLGITTTKLLSNGDVYFSVYLPAVMLGTVGGGTTLSTQKEARSIIGVEKSTELAEILVGAVLAGELSLLSSLSEGSLARAHERLGR